MFQFNIAIYLAILLSIIGSGCYKPNQDSTSNPDQVNRQPLIVFLHGLGSDASCFDRLKKELEPFFPDDCMIALKSVEENNRTCIFSIKEQTNARIRELSEKVPDLDNRSIVIIGHSQGGIGAYKMYDASKDPLHKNLHIKGIITLATPWEGAPILNTDTALFSEYLNHPLVVKDMHKFSIALGQDADWLKHNLDNKLSFFHFGSYLDGFKDLKPGSALLDWVKNTLPDAKIPILAIGGGQSDFSVFLPKKINHDFKALRNAWTQIIVGKTKHSKAHDMTVPLYSQLAWNIVPKGNKNFQRVIIPDAIHDEILGLPPSAKSKKILEHPDTFKYVKQFAEEVLYRACNPKTNREQERANTLVRSY